ncbi:hypothetical protein [Actinomycetospora atypica]|uniref:Uncharacterized protein n=1 Tax=Actinomycetospora atypica TaxID=1290095 RepID=A0ABV9YQ36_9PSEU
MIEPAADVLGRLVLAATRPTRGRFRASATVTTVAGPPPAEIPLRYSPFRDDGPTRTGTVEVGCLLVVDGPEHWQVTRDDGGVYERDGDRLLLGYPGQAPVDAELGDARVPTALWSAWSEHWVEELVLPHRLLGLLDDVRIVDDAPDRPRLSGRTSLRQPEAYSGIAREEVLEVEFVADLQLGVLLEATSTTWNHHVDRYSLEVIAREAPEDGPGEIRPGRG